MVDPEAENGSKLEKVETENYALNIFQSSLNLLAHIFIGIVVGISVLFAFRNGVTLNNMTNVHIVLCVVGVSIIFWPTCTRIPEPVYLNDAFTVRQTLLSTCQKVIALQYLTESVLVDIIRLLVEYQLLMAEGILALCPHNSWTARMTLVDKRRTHTVLLILGSVLAILGTILKSNRKEINWETPHGKYGLVAMVFTTVSLVNGLTSLYAYELRKYIPGNVSKITHIIFGIVAFVTSLISLCYALDYSFFTTWTSSVGPPFGFAYAMMAMAAAFTSIIIINPVITAFNKTIRICK